MTQVSPKQTSYKWYALALAALTHTFVVAIPTMAMPVLFKEISEDLGLSLVQIGAYLGSGLANRADRRPDWRLGG